MIADRSEVILLLENFICEQSEYIKNSFSPYQTTWTTQKMANYQFGPVLGKLIEKDTDLMSVLKKGVSDTTFYDELRIYFGRQVKKYSNPGNDSIQKDYFDSYQNWLKEFQSWTLEELIAKLFPVSSKYMSELSSSEAKVFIFLNYAFKNYQTEKNLPYNSDLFYIAKEYESIFDKQSQFGKYGVIPVDNDRELIPCFPPRLYDSFLNKTFFIKNIPKELVNIFLQMRTDNMIEKLCVRLQNMEGYQGKNLIEYCQEELERGKYFDFAELGIFSISKLYSTEYEDSLWINTDSENITFEELCTDFITFEDLIVTQVVHLQYKSIEHIFYITHLDHEYVFYTLEEYEKRLSDVKQKGTAKQKLKSFKIDDSKIPFNYQCENYRRDENGKELPVEKIPFLYYVLETYFCHKDLLKEYFQNVLSA